jgi:hypothetical protein
MNTMILPVEVNSTMLQPKIIMCVDIRTVQGWGAHVCLASALDSLKDATRQHNVIMHTF